MIGSVIIAMFSGSLLAVTLLLVGWPVWVAILAYMGCGMLVLVFMATLKLFRWSISRTARLIVSVLSRRQYQRAYATPRTVATLSDSYTDGNGR